MSAIDVIAKLSNTKLMQCDLKYCLVTSTKLPKKIDGSLAKPNNINDFVSFSELLLHTEPELLDECAGVGISIQGSRISAIDVDHCFSIPNDVNSIDSRGKEILEVFKDTYCEFSFSGTGLRILLTTPIIDNYSLQYYIKNEKTNVEYYQPTKSFRYVTLTGNYIYNNDIKKIDDISEFLNKYMKKEVRKIYTKKSESAELNNEELKKKIKKLYFKNLRFQDLWFGQAPGSGKNESELDYELIAYLYENITTDKDKIQEIFESSPYFKSKDYKHKKKWENQEYRYYNYVYTQIERSH